MPRLARHVALQAFRAEFPKLCSLSACTGMGAGMDWNSQNARLAVTRMP